MQLKWSESLFLSTLEDLLITIVNKQWNGHFSHVKIQYVKRSLKLLRPNKSPKICAIPYS